MYDFWQFLHVTSAIVWGGSAALGVFLSFRLAAARTNPIAAPATRLMDAKAVPLFIIASLLTLVTGLVLAFGWVGFDPLWIKIGLGGIVISIAMGIGYFKPSIAKLEKAVQEHGEDDPGVHAIVRQTNLVSLIELVVFLIVVWAMVTKP